jgi:hypothetical protein
MPAAAGEPGTDAAHADALGPLGRAGVRATLTGSIFAMSVLAYLGDHGTTLVAAVVTVAATGLVIFFGEAYAGLFSMALASARPLTGAQVREELGACSLAAAPGILAGAVLLVADLLGLGVDTAVDVALWLGVLTLFVGSVVEAHGSHRSLPVRFGSVVVSVVLGVGIIVAKAALH